jgi:hypothetical protein
LQRRARLDPEVADECLPRLSVAAQRICLPARAVEREHQLPAQALAQRMVGDERVELADQLLVQAAREVAVDPLHPRDEAVLVESVHLVASGRLELDPVERRTPPEGERVAEQLRGGGDIAGARSRLGVADEPLEPGRVQLLRRDRDDIPGMPRRDRRLSFLPKRLPQLRDVNVERLLGRRRR